MQVKDDYMDELFTRKLGNLEATPPEDGWHRIESELNRRSRNNRRFWLAAASFALLLSVTASVIYLQTNSTPSGQEIVSVVRDDQPEPVQQQQPAPVESGVTDATHDVSHSEPGEQTLHIRNEAVARNETTVASSPVSRQDEAIEVTPSISVEPHVSLTNVAAPDQSSTAAAQPRTSVYVDSWDEMMRMQPLKASRLETLTKRATLPRPGIAVDKPVIVATSPPKYDEFAFVDVANIAANTKPQNRWEITGQFAPVYSYRAITNVPGGMNKSDFDEAESGLLAYSGGITVAYKVAGRISIQTGVFYSQMGQSINSVTPVNNMYAAVSSNNSYPKNFVRTSSGNVTVVSNMKADVNTTYASYFNAESQANNAKSANVLAANVSKPVKYRLIERIDYLEIPVMVRYKVIDRKLNFYLLGGMSTNILVDNNVFVDNGSDLVKEGTILMARPVNYSGTFGMGVSYRIMGNLLIDIEPSFKYYLLPYTTNSQISSNPYAFGLFTGVVYQF